MTVPFLDLKAQYESIKDEISIALQNVLSSTAFAGGRFVEKFEQEFAEFCQSKHVIGVGSGTEALWLSLLALGIGQGDEVITVPNTFFATAEAISFCGAKPVFVDVDEKTYNLNPALLEEAITSSTKAIIPVHLFGQMADMDPIMETAQRHGLYVIEDACQAQGSTYKGRCAGSIGDVGCFSFYPGKNLGAYGEAGAVVTDKDNIAHQIRRFRDHGQSEKYYHEVIGWNARMDGLQGAVLSVKLRHLEDWNGLRKKHAAAFNRNLSEINDLICPYQADYAGHIYHIYAIRVKKRDILMRHLKEKGVSCGIHYPVAVHQQAAYIDAGLKNASFPITEMCAAQLLSLPMFPELTESQINFVTEEIGIHLSESSNREKNE